MRSNAEVELVPPIDPQIDVSDSPDRFLDYKSSRKSERSSRPTQPSCRNRASARLEVKSSWRSLTLEGLAPRLIELSAMEPGRSRAPYCRTDAGTLSSSRPRGQGAVVHTGSSAVKGGDGSGLETFDDQPDAQRKLP